MIKHKIRNLLALTAVTLFASSCIGVKNVEKAWNKSKGDAELIGIWKGNGDDKCAFIKTEKDYLITTGTNGLEGGCKSFESEGHKFVIVADLGPSLLGFADQDADSKNGTVLRYEVKGDKLTMYSLDGEVLKKAIQAKEVPGTVEDDSPELNELDDATIKWLGKSVKGKGWSPTVYKKVK